MGLFILETFMQCKNCLEYSERFWQEASLRTSSTKHGYVHQVALKVYFWVSITIDLGKFRNVFQSLCTGSYLQRELESLTFSTELWDLTENVNDVTLCQKVLHHTDFKSYSKNIYLIKNQHLNGEKGKATQHSTYYMTFLQLVQ